MFQLSIHPDIHPVIICSSYPYIHISLPLSVDVFNPVSCHILCINSIYIYLQSFSIFWKGWKYHKSQQKPYIEEHTIQWAKQKWQTGKQLSKHYTENLRLSNANSTKNGIIPVLEKVSWKGHHFLLNYWHPTWYMIQSNDELYIRQMEHIRGHLWHRYFVTVN